LFCAVCQDGTIFVASMLLRLRHRPHPRRRTRFPYTTLFRSDRVDEFPNLVCVECIMASGVHGSRNLVTKGAGCASTVDTSTSAGDRKSTRLNSSHVSISYAVFCLKKKNAH